MQKRIWIVALTIVALLALTAGNAAIYNDIVTQKLLVINGTELRGSATTGADLAVGTTLNVGTALTVGTFRADTKATAATVTTDGTITPAGSYQPITSAGNVQTSVIAGCASGTAGETVELVNVGSNTIVITDTSTLKLAGNATLGVTDVLGLRCDGTNWVQTYKSDN